MAYAVCLLYFRFIFLSKVLIVDICHISCMLPYIWLALASLCTAGSSGKIFRHVHHKKKLYLSSFVLVLWLYVCFLLYTNFYYPISLCFWLWSCRKDVQRILRITTISLVGGVYNLLEFFPIGLGKCLLFPICLRKAGKWSHWDVLLCILYFKDVNNHLSWKFFCYLWQGWNLVYLDWLKNFCISPMGLLVLAHENSIGSFLNVRGLR